MGFIDKLQAELKDAMVEHQALVLVQVLRKRLDTLTLGDLRTILDSRLGQGLSAVLVRDLVVPPTPAPPADATTSRPSTRRARKRSKRSGKEVARTTPATKASAQKKSAKTRGSAKAKAKAVSKAARSHAKSSTRSVDGAPRVSALTVAGREQYDGALVQYLREHPGYNKPRVIRAAVGGTKLQFRIAMQRLEEKGQVQRQGTHGTTQYAVKP